MRIILAGPSRCGKDTAAEYIRLHSSLRFEGSASEYLLPYVANEMELTLDWLRAHRHEPAIRELLFSKGNELRARDPGILVRQAWDRNAVLIGFRDPREMQVLRNMAEADGPALFVWIDRDVPPDPTLQYGPELCDIALPNRGTLDEFHRRLASLLKFAGLNARPGAV